MVRPASSDKWKSPWVSTSNVRVGIHCRVISPFRSLVRMCIRHTWASCFVTIGQLQKKWNFGSLAYGIKKKKRIRDEWYVSFACSSPSLGAKNKVFFLNFNINCSINFQHIFLYPCSLKQFLLLIVFSACLLSENDNHSGRL